MALPFEDSTLTLLECLLHFSDYFIISTKAQRREMFANNDFECKLHHTLLGTKDVFACHLQSFLVLSRPILFRQPPKYEDNGFLHLILDCINVYPFQMDYRDTPPFSTFHIGEKIEDVLFEVNFFAINI